MKCIIDGTKDFFAKTVLLQEEHPANSYDEIKSFLNSYSKNNFSE